MDECTTKMGYILIIDKDPVIRQNVSEYFSTHNIPAISAPDWSELKDTDGPPSLIVMDRQTSRNDGLDWLRSIRSKSDVPVIMTGYRPLSRPRAQLCRRARSLSHHAGFGKHAARAPCRWPFLRRAFDSLFPFRRHLRPHPLPLARAVFPDALQIETERTVDRRCARTVCRDGPDMTLLKKLLERKKQR